MARKAIALEHVLGRSSSLSWLALVAAFAGGCGAGQGSNGTGPGAGVTTGSGGMTGGNGTGGRSAGGASGGQAGQAQGGQSGQAGPDGGAVSGAGGAGGAAGQGGSPPAGQRTLITVAAGEYERQQTVVSFPLGPGHGGKSLVLRAEGGQALPLQVSADGQAVFVLPTLAAGGRLSFAVEEVSSTAAVVKAVRESDGVVLNIGASKVLRYQMQGKLPGGVGAQFLRGGYLHPVLTPGGAVVTDDYPGDHRHHHGIWSAWAHTTFEGQDIDFWNMGQRTAKVDFEELASTWDGPVHGGLRSKQVHVSLAGGAPKIALREEWAITAYRTHDGQGAAPYFLFDLDSTQQAASASTVMLEKYIYGGFGLRGAAGWGGGGGATFLTAEGRTRANGDGTTTRWCHIGGRVGNGPVGYAALGHPANFRAPQPVRINPTDPFFSIAPVQSSGFPIEPGKPYVSRYRIVVADGPADKALLDRLWNDYAHPPVVTVAPAAGR